jgi:magnesium-transporting ATPase (P-type)
MGITGTDVAREAADMILLDDNFASIVAAVEEGRGVFQNLRKFLTYILTSNIPEVVPYLAFVVLRIPLPLTVMQILAVDLGTDMLPALALGTEKPHHTVMQQPPRPRGERLMNAPLLARAYGFLGLIEAAAAMAAYFFVLEAGGWQYGELLAGSDTLYQQATTACLGAIIVMQMMNVWLCRSHTESAFRSGLFSNPMIHAGLLLEVLLLVVLVYTPIGQRIFGTAPLDNAVWWFILPFAVGMLLLEELRKLWLRSRGQN